MEFDEIKQDILVWRHFGWKRDYRLFMRGNCVSFLRPKGGWRNFDVFSAAAGKEDLEIKMNNFTSGNILFKEKQSQTVVAEMEHAHPQSANVWIKGGSFRVFNRLDACRFQSVIHPTMEWRTILEMKYLDYHGRQHSMEEAVAPDGVQVATVRFLEIEDRDPDPYLMALVSMIYCRFSLTSSG